MHLTFQGSQVHDLTFISIRDWNASDVGTVKALIFKR
jgi:hypothetical protein